MINADMRTYNYYLYGAADDYGQQTLIKDDTGAPKVQGTIKIAINITSQSIQGNINYLDCSYIGLTHDNNINDSYVIQYGEDKIKALYVNSKGKLKQVFLQKI